MKPAIEVNNLRKCYTINHKNKASYSTLKDDLANLVKKPLGKGKATPSEEKFWALDDLNFTVNPGEIFGVIGRNGSGKSTLLKILSRIIEPTSGSVRLRGRTASLLEVGTGFHPELTGRENIYFNGSMLGMSRQEISRKFDEIVAFAEIEKFLDTPVKFYSSGMYVRLAFSVAAHLDPEILILDEVLAVGDAAFQQKSLNKITATMEQGTTVLFVSHSMGAVQKLCSRGMLLDRGKITYMGDVDELTSRYLDSMREEMPEIKIRSTWKSDQNTQNDYFIPEKMYLTNHEGKKISGAAPNNIDKWVTIEANILKPSENLTMGIAVYSQNKSLMFISFPTDTHSSQWPKLITGRQVMRAKIPAHFLNEGHYKISLVGGIHNRFWIYEPGTPGPSIEMEIKEGLSESRYWKTAREGALAPIIEWEVHEL